MGQQYQQMPANAPNYGRGNQTGQWNPPNAGGNYGAVNNGYSGFQG